MSPMSRRSVVAGAGAAAMSTMFAGSMWRAVLSRGPALTTGSRYGPLGAPDANGVRLPAGFRSRVVGRTGDVVPGTAFAWHAAPDGGGCFGRDGGGWFYVSNSEVGSGQGGASAIGFDAQGSIVAAHSVLSGTSRNCAGGVTPWGTWLSCEESGDGGNVWECDPRAPGDGIRLPLLGSFNHEAAAVDPVTGAVYLTEDRRDGRLYRFTPVTPGDLGAGTLQAAVVSGDPAVGPAAVTWRTASPTAPDRSPETAAFDGGEGAWVDDGLLLFTTKGDRKVWELDLRTARLTVLHDCLAEPGTPLDAVDNIVVHRRTGDIFVAEDGGNMELCSIERLADHGRRIGTFLRIEGQAGSEITGPAFTPDGDRLYVSSQRGPDGRGLTYEITGRFGASPIDRGAAGAIRPATRLGATAT